MPRKGVSYTLPNVPLADYIWGKCQEYGEQVAFIDKSAGGKSLTFTKLYELSRNCASFLHKRGVKRGDFICVCAPSCVEYVIAMLGITGCGASLTHCNPSFKEGEIMQQFLISEPKMVIVHEEAVETMKRVSSVLPCLEVIFVIGESEEYTTFETICRTPGDMSFLKDREINPAKDIAILPYSSGTTGLPKSVMLTHTNMVAIAHNFISDMKRGETGNVGYMDRPMYHGGGFFTVLSTLLRGVTLVMERKFVIEKVMKTVQDFKVNYFIAVPPILIELANATESEKYDTSSLIAFFVSGAVIAPDIRRRLEEKYNVGIIPGYGMTESGIITTGTDRKNDLYSVGTVCANTEIKVIDLHTSEECPDGIDGEVVVRGKQVAIGYLKNPEANAIAFQKDGWLHTGDLGHFDEDGRLYITGRLKEIIKYKSLQVPPAELEGELLKHPKIADVGVIGIPDPYAGELPKAFVVRKDKSLTEKDVEEFIKSQLVDYKHLRGGVEFVDSIPKSFLGKIQRKELRKMAGIEV